LKMGSYILFRGNSLLFLMVLLVFSVSFSQIIFLEDQFNGNDGDQINLNRWENPEDFRIQDNCLHIYTSGTGWEKAVVWSRNQYDFSTDPSNIYFAFRPESLGVPIIPGNQQAKAMIGYCTDTQNPQSFDKGVWFAVTGDGSNYYMGIQDLGTDSLDIVRSYDDFPSEIRLEIIPDTGGFGGIARLYLDGSDTPVQTRDWGYSDPDSPGPDEELSNTTVYLSVQSNNYPGSSWVDYIICELVPDEAIINSVTYRDIDTQDTEYTNETNIEAILDVNEETLFSELNFSENVDFSSGTGWIAFQNPVQFDILTTDGQKTIYCKGRDYYNIETNVVENTIFLDRQIPSATVDPLPSETTINPFQITYQYQDPEPASGVSSVALYYRFSGTGTGFSIKNSKDIYTESVNKQVLPLQDDWTLYELQDPPTGEFTFDVNNANGVGYYEFQAVAIDNAGNVEELGDAEASTTVTSSDIPQILAIPNPFTPNNDGINDNVYFSSTGTFSGNAKLKIFNRYGELIFSTSGTAPLWDGRDESGNWLPSDTYIYQIEYSGNVYNGTVTMVK
jgi:gliding motility-associated-like protein